MNSPKDWNKLHVEELELIFKGNFTYKVNQILQLYPVNIDCENVWGQVAVIISVDWIFIIMDILYFEVNWLFCGSFMSILDVAPLVSTQRLKSCSGMSI